MGSFVLWYKPPVETGEHPRVFLIAFLVPLLYQKDRQAADQAVAPFIERYQKVSPPTIEWLKCDLEACLTSFAFPKNHWKTILNNNVIERLFGEVK